MGTTIKLREREPPAGFVRHRVMIREDTLAFVIQALLPFTTHSSPFNSALVFIPPTRSEPAPGSVRAKAPRPSVVEARPGSQRCFCASDPKMEIGLHPRLLCASTESAVPPHTMPSSSSAMAALMVSTPGPPYSSGISIPSRPSGTILRNASVLNSHAASSSAAMGLTS